jgi:hypothetical protein
MKELNLSSRITQNKETLSSAIDDELVLLSIINNKYYGMDSVGSRVWSLLAEPITINDMITTLTGEYDIPATESEKDVFSFLNELYSENLIIIADE